MYHSARNVIHHYLVEVIAVDDDEMTDLLFCALSLSSLFLKKKQDGYINSWFKWKKNRHVPSSKPDETSCHAC